MCAWGGGGALSQWCDSTSGIIFNVSTLRGKVLKECVSVCVCVCVGGGGGGGGGGAATNIVPVDMSTTLVSISVAQRLVNILRSPKS